MAVFEPAIELVLEHEGSAFTDDPADPGGATRWGITLDTLREARPDATADDVRRLTRAEALEIYRARWWAPLHLDLVVDQQLATKILDLAVNLGQRGGVRLLQRALAAVGRPVGVDGVLGPKTLAETNACSPRDLLLELGAHQASHYRRWVEANEEREKFRRGLMARAAWPYPGRVALTA